MPHLALSLLGTFRATLDGERIAGFESAKVRALLAYLAVENDRPHARETLAGLLWSDFPNRDALRNLRLALSNLRQAIGDHRADPPFLLITRDTIQFNAASDHSLDVAAILQLPISNLQSPPTARFLDGFSCDSAPFEEWLLLKREQIGQRVLRALRDLTARAEERGEYDRAQTYARQQLELEPWDEHAHQQLMRALASGGQRSAALAQYETCRRLLKQELNVEPARETTALYESIRDGKLKPRAPTNVPLPLTSFVGRERELRELRELVGKTRLLTLTGAGGCGKTRLALQVATELACRDDPAGRLYQNGIWFVDLAPLADPALVTQAVATAFNLGEAPGMSLLAALTDYLRAKELLLVIDNCEHLLGACAQLIGTLPSACPKLQIVATSRESLNIGGETVWRAPSLASPPLDAERLPPLAQLRQYDAIQLFDARATAVAANWRLVENAVPAAQICARLDGIPLAIELAAARLKVLSTQEIAARLDNRFNLLTGGSRTGLPRHQTLRATMDWSYDLLSDAERALLRRLSVFAGGFSLEAVEAVVGRQGTGDRGQGAEISPLIPDLRSLTPVLDLLTSLIDKSLVVVETRNGATRYRLLETVRQYAREKLNAANEVEIMRARHLDFFVKLGVDAELKLKGPAAKEWMDHLETEYDNIRAVFEYAMTDDVAAAVQLAWSLVIFWVRRGYLIEGRNVMLQLLARPELQGANRLRLQALKTIGCLQDNLNDSVAVRAYFEEGLSIAKMLEDESDIAFTLQGMGRALMFLSDYPAARPFIEASLVLYQKMGDRWGEANSLQSLGKIVYPWVSPSTASRSLKNL
jgi:predicted ATPase/DNA-binding SARP family transcriptional activator